MKRDKKHVPRWIYTVLGAVCIVTGLYVHNPTLVTSGAGLIKSSASQSGESFQDEGGE